MTTPPDADRTPHWIDRPDPERMADAATAAHRAAFDAEPDGVWAAPGRITLIGEHVDYNQGVTLLVALPYGTYVAARRRSDDVVRVMSAQASTAWEGSLRDLEPGAVAGWPAYAVGAVWAVRAAGYDVGGIDLSIDSAVPWGAGLSSSAALVCSVAAAVADLAGAPDLLADADGRARLADLAVRAETDFVGAPTGGMDQAVSLRATAGHALGLDCRDGSVQPVPLDLLAVDRALLVIDTRAPHSHVDGAYVERRRSCERAARALRVSALRDVTDVAAVARLDPLLTRRARHVVSEIGRVRKCIDLLVAGHVDAIGPLLDASHLSLRNDFEVSAPELDLAVSVARSAGAVGARMTGGGFGGSAIALVPAPELRAVATSVAAAFAAAGYRQPQFLHGSPSGPAARVR